MKLADRIRLIDDLIRENPDVTIKDYLELCKELGQIEATNVPDPIIILRQVEQELMKPKTRKTRGGKLEAKYLRTYKLR